VTDDRRADGRDTASRHQRDPDGTVRRRGRSERDVDALDPDPSRPVRRAFGLGVRRPRLAWPFALAAVVVALADAARLLDPVGNAYPNAVETTLSLSPMVYPSGTRATTVLPGAVIGLEPVWIPVAFALAVVPAIAVGSAIASTVGAVTDGVHSETHGGRPAVTDADTAATAEGSSSGVDSRSVAVVVYVLAVVFATEWVAGFVAQYELLALPWTVVVFWLAARLFPAPALAALDRSPFDAAAEAFALTEGRTLGLAVSVLGVGTLANALVKTPALLGIPRHEPAFALGTAVSYLLAGTLGAVATATYAIEARDERRVRRHRRRRARRRFATSDADDARDGIGRDGPGPTDAATRDGIRRDDPGPTDTATRDEWRDGDDRDHGE
jgi:hypothetical protein